MLYPRSGFTSPTLFYPAASRVMCACSVLRGEIKWHDQSQRLIGWCTSAVWVGPTYIISYVRVPHTSIGKAKIAIYQCCCCRLMVIPKKKLPSPSKHERFYAFIGEAL
jgi:hypothetical protein